MHVDNYRMEERASQNGRAGGRILVVDDDVQVCRLLERILRDAGHDVAAVTDAQNARAALQADRFTLLVADVRLPGQSGIDLVRESLAEHPDLAALMVSGLDDPDVARLALDSGAFGYVTKPLRHADVAIAVMNALRRREHEISRRAAQERLERMVADRSADLQAVISRLDATNAVVADSWRDAVGALALAVEYRDVETGAHIERMSAYCGLLAGRCGLNAESMRLASQLHDIGKIAVPDSVLRKPGPLTADERCAMERHTTIGHEMLQGSSSEVLQLAGLIALTHHERWDGTGYPYGLAGADIPVEGRIAAIADAFDALTTNRIYRPAMPIEDAVSLMEAERGTHFDPELLDLFLAALPEVAAVHRRLTAGQPAPA